LTKKKGRNSADWGSMFAPSGTKGIRLCGNPDEARAGKKKRDKNRGSREEGLIFLPRKSQGNARAIRRGLEKKKKMS